MPPVTDGDTRLIAQRPLRALRLTRYQIPDTSRLLVVLCSVLRVDVSIDL